MPSVGETPPGTGPYKLAWRRLRRNKVALAFGGLFLLIVILCFLAPVYSHDIAHIGPNDETHIEQALGATGHPDRADVDVGHFLLGADTNGRDVAVRLLYGGRTSLEIGFIAMLITMILATMLGTIAGFMRGIDRRRALALLRAALGLPGAAARHRARHEPADRRDQPRLRHAHGRLDLGPGGDHRDRLHPLRRQADSRAGADAARARVRRRRAPAWPRLARGSWRPRSCRTWPRRSSSSSR